MVVNYSETNPIVRDPYELDRLAEELAEREAEHPPAATATSSDLPQLLPLSHDNPYLISEEFNVEEFLLSRSYTSLPDLRTELREYLATLKEELVKLINDDYEAFISLSTDLQGDGDRLENIKSPLIDLRSQILVSRDQLQGIQDSVKEKLERRAALREEKALLQLLLKISDSISRLESLLLITPSSEKSPSSETAFDVRNLSVDENVDEKAKGNRAKRLLRIVTEYTQLLYHAEKASSRNCVFVTEMQWRIERIKSTLSSDLEHHFTTTLLSLITSEKSQAGKTIHPESERIKHMSDLIDCLQAYDLLCLWRDAEDVIRREVVRGFVKKTIFPGALSGPHSPVLPHTPSPLVSLGSSQYPFTPYTPYTAFASKQNSLLSHPTDFDSTIYLLDDAENPLAALYNKVLRFISEHLKTVMEAADRISLKNPQRAAGSSSLSVNITGDGIANDYFDILSNVVWVEVSRAIMDDLGSLVFAAGRPDEFHKNYETTQAFLRSIEYLAPSLQSVGSLRRHPSFQAFERRWQLPIYFQLRWKDIVSSVVEVLESKALSAPVNGLKSKDADVTFLTNQSAVVWSALCQCWSTEIYLPDLGHRFWRLTLQLLKRYRVWLESNFVNVTAKSKTPAANKVTGTAASGSRPSTPAPSQDSQFSDRTVDEDGILHQCATLMQDVKGMERAMWTLWRQQISLMLPQHLINDDDIEGQPEGVLRSSLTSLTDVLPLLSSQVETILIRRCCDSLAPVKSLPGQFRATSQRNIPTKPSTFVPLILRPVKTFFGVGTGGSDTRALRESFCVPVSTNVVGAVASRYMTHVTAMRKAEDSLRRLRVGKRTGFSLFGGSGASNEDDSRDEERVRTQLILDVEAFGKDAEALGVDLDHSAAFKALNYSVHANAVDAETA
ncbi:hypothetical protein M0805_000698 [Coniferiporia weirii]|nr:hypothetical protein M0805_000698 [Coniferiporia weirii]